MFTAGSLTAGFIPARCRAGPSGRLVSCGGSAPLPSVVAAWGVGWSLGKISWRCCKEQRDRLGGAGCDRDFGG